METQVKLTKIRFEYSNGSVLEVNAEDLDTLSKAFMLLIEKLKQMGDVNKKSQAKTMYKCKNCGKEFPVVAWIEMATTTYPTFSFSGIPGTLAVTNTNWQSTTTIKKPICPYCQQLDIQEIKEKDEFLEQFKQEFMKAVAEKIAADKKS